LWLKGATSPEQLRERGKQDSAFRKRLLDFIASIACECMPPKIVSDADYVPKSHIFRLLLRHDDPNFEYNMAADLYDIVSWRQMHS